MISFKTVSKYILGQFLFVFKNIFYPTRIDIETIKTLFITAQKRDSVFNNFLKKKNKNFIYILDSLEFQNFNINHNNRVIHFDFTKFPETNADLLMFDNSSINKLSLLNNKPNYICISLITFLLNVFPILKFAFTKKYFFKTLKYWNGLDIVFESRNKNQNLTSRRYIPIEFSRIEFLKILCENKINNVVLRWFEYVELIDDPFEDIDILIETQHVKKFDKITYNKIGIFPLDVYSTTGEIETSYANLPYFPLKISEDILLNKVLWNDMFYVPNADYHLISMVYHVVFHKSLSSGVGIYEDIKMIENTKRDYISVLKDLFEKSAFSIDNITLTSLFCFLDKLGCLPEYDLLLKLQVLKNDKWLEQIKIKYKARYEADFDKVEGLTVYLLRDLAVSPSNIKMITEYLDLYGFKIIKQDYIKQTDFISVKQKIRGGKWDKGPFDINSGPPRYYFLVFDAFSKKPKEQYSVLYPNLENEKVIKVKLSLRDKINIKQEETLNGLHSSDDFYESIFYLEQLGYDKNNITSIIKDCILYKKQYSTSYNVIKNMSRFALRAKVELIEYKGGLAVKKTYRVEHLDFLSREIWLLKELKDTSFVPELLEEGENYMIVEYIENALNLGENEDVRLKTKNIIQLRQFFEVLYNKHITILDANPSNVLIDLNDNIKVIDFEYAQLYKKRPLRIFNIYELKKIELKNVIVYPGGHENIKNAYNKFWKYRIYLTRIQFFYIKNEFFLNSFIRVNKYFFSIEKFLIITLKRIFRMFRREYFRFVREVNLVKKP